MDIVKFEGSWTDHDKRVVLAAVHRAEAILDLEVPESLIGKPWLCQYDIDPGQPRYLARRVNLDYDFTGEAPAELAKDLLMMASEKRRQAPLAVYWSPPEFRRRSTGSD